MGLSLSKTWNGERVTPYLVSLCKRCGWPSHVVRACDPLGSKASSLPDLRRPSGTSRSKWTIMGSLP